MLLKFFFTSLELFVFQERSGPTKQGDFHSSDLSVFTRTLCIEVPPGCRRTHNLAVLHLCWLRWSLQLLLEESTSTNQDLGKREGSWTPTPQKKGCLIPSRLAPKTLSQNCLALPRKRFISACRWRGKSNK